jgi:hypothetical protein
MGRTSSREERDRIAAVIEAEDRRQLLALARERPGPVLRVIFSRLYSSEPGPQGRAVAALGELAAAGVLAAERLRDLLRRLLWSLNDESGGVPYGAPEALGEVLARRPDLQPEYLGLLCALASEPQVSQTGPIERGVFWALGRIGPEVARRYPAAVRFLSQAAACHPDEQSRRAAAEALTRIRTPGPA